MPAHPTTNLIWSMLSDDLRRFIRRRVVDDHVADDLLQETFVLIHKNLEQLAEADRLAPWVYRIARNVVYGHYRKSALHATSLGDADIMQEASDPQILLGDRAHQWLDELINQLPESYRQAIQLAEREGIPQHEVAERLGLSLSGAKSRIQRGRVALRGILDQCCTFEFDRRGRLTECDPKPDQTICRGCDEMDEQR